MFANLVARCLPVGGYGWTCQATPMHPMHPVTALVLAYRD
jgi:hypothetical protein